MTTAVLETRNLCCNFGALQVARSINFTLETGARHALIGPNGAGKTSFVNLLTGALPPSSGDILLRGEAISHLPQSRRARRGIVRTYQINQLFKGLTVLENVCLAVAERCGAASNLWRPAGARRAVADEAFDVLSALRLQEDAFKPVRELPYGRQRLVEIALALSQRPDVLLLDEPAAGVSSAESHIILEAIEALPADMAVLIIEHDMDVVFRFADRITVLVAGAVLIEGTPQEVGTDAQVRAVYLGEAAHG